MNREEFIIPRDMDEITAEPDHQRLEVKRSAITTYRKEEKLNVGDPVPELELEQLEETGPVPLIPPGKPPCSSHLRQLYLTPLPPPVRRSSAVF